MSNSTPHQGMKNVWVTRPDDQCENWRALLQASGYQTQRVPLLAIVPLQSEAAKQQIKSRILDLDLYQTVLFVSQNAVNYFFDACEDYWPQLPAKLVFAGVGIKTTKLLKARMQQMDPGAHITVWENDLPMDSEALLAQTFLKNVDQSRILICRGLGGRPKLAEALTSRGAKVDLCELYERALPAEALALCETALRETPNVIPVFSGESFQNLETLLQALVDAGKVAASDLEALRAHCCIVVPSARVGDLARNHGWAQVVCAANATDEEMLKAVQAAV